MSDHWICAHRRTLHAREKPEIVSYWPRPPRGSEYGAWTEFSKNSAPLLFLFGNPQ